MALSLGGAAYDGVQVQIRLAVLAAEVAGHAAQLIGRRVKARLVIHLRTGVEHAEGHVIAGADACHSRHADVLFLRELEQRGAELFALVYTHDYLVPETSVFHD